MLDEFVRSCAEQSLRILDNVGIRIDTRKLPSYKLLADATARKYGTNLFSRFWCRHIRPWLQPMKHAAIDVIWQDATKQNRIEFMDAILSLNQE
jgi:hypothetical protein